jgi:hypothetical protein
VETNTGREVEQEEEQDMDRKEGMNKKRKHQADKK